MLRWSSKTLADRANVGVATIYRVESVDGVPKATMQTLIKIQQALERFGLAFPPDGGIVIDWEKGAPSSERRSGERP